MRSSLHLAVLLAGPLVSAAEHRQFHRWSAPPESNLVRRQGYESSPPGYPPEFGTCGSGTSCEDACGTNWESCTASTDLSLFCYNRIDLGQTCCGNGSGRACDRGYYCAWNRIGGRVWCCRDGQSREECGVIDDPPTSTTSGPTQTSTTTTTVTNSCPTVSIITVTETKTETVTSASVTVTTAVDTQTVTVTSSGGDGGTQTQTGTITVISTVSVTITRGGCCYDEDCEPTTEPEPSCEPPTTSDPPYVPPTLPPPDVTTTPKPCEPKDPHCHGHHTSGWHYKTVSNTITKKVPCPEDYEGIANHYGAAAGPINGTTTTAIVTGGAHGMRRQQQGLGGLPGLAVAMVAAMIVL